MTDQELIEFEIDGKKVSAKPGEMVMKAADAQMKATGDRSLYIPRYCYHDKLSVAANCRMCLVEVEDARGKSPKPMPACAMPVAPGLKVYTKSKVALDAQRAVMEFLLINHPLDCPVCEQAGQCELQDNAMGYGGDKSMYDEPKRTVYDEDIGPLVQTYLTRCIQCTRCVRFSEEVDGLRELGIVRRGENAQIRTFDGRPMTSVVSGNVVDLCPVGALNAKPSSFKGRAYEYAAHATISPHDCLGSNMALHTRRDVVMRAAPNENESLNEVWLSDRDRFSYEGLNSKRLTTPLMKKNGEWKEASWEDALHHAAGGLRKVMNEYGEDKVGALASAQSTTEECYLLQKVCRGLGVKNIDYRLRQTDFRDQHLAAAYPKLGINIADLDSLNAVLLIGSNVRHEQPLASLRLRKAALAGADVMQLSVLKHPMNFNLSEQLACEPSRVIENLVGIAKALQEQLDQNDKQNIEALFASVESNDQHKAVAAKLLKGEKSAIILGEIAANHPQAAEIRALAQIISRATQSNFGFLTTGANAAGASIAGLLPHRGPAGNALTDAGLDVATMFNSKLRAYVLLNMDPDLDCANPTKVNEAIAESDFVVVVTPYMNASLADNADVILPSVPFSETSGTFVNAQGDWQSFKGAVKAYANARPAWKILRVLGNLFELEGFDFESSQEVLKELQGLCDAMPSDSDKSLDKIEQSLVQEDVIERIAEFPIYSSDQIVRRATALQKTMQAQNNCVRINSALSESLGVKQGDTVNVMQGSGRVELAVEIDDAVPNNCASVAAGIAATHLLGESFGLIKIGRR